MILNAHACLCVSVMSTVTDNHCNVDRLSAVDVTPGCFPDKGFVLGDAHPAVNVERLGAHPEAYELDHRVFYTGRMACVSSEHYGLSRFSERDR